MTARIILRGRTLLATPGWRPPKPAPAAGERCAAAIPSQRSRGLEAGLIFSDPEEDVVYRALPRLDPREGWAVTDFWCERWKVDHAAVCEFARRGLLDAAVEVCSQVRRYRVRDERELRESEAFKRHARRCAKARRDLSAPAPPKLRRRLY